MFDEIFLLQQVKRIVIISNKHDIYEFYPPVAEQLKI